jgi:hypothetical protein
MPVGLHSFFTEPGGHSQPRAMVSELRTDRGLRLSMMDVYDYPTIEKLAAFSRFGQSSGCGTDESVSASDRRRMILRRSPRRGIFYAAWPGGGAVLHSRILRSVAGPVLTTPG